MFRTFKKWVYHKVDEFFEVEARLKRRIETNDEIMHELLKFKAQELDKQTAEKWKRIDSIVSNLIKVTSWSAHDTLTVHYTMSMHEVCLLKDLDDREMLLSHIFDSFRHKFMSLVPVGKS